MSILKRFLRRGSAWSCAFVLPGLGLAVTAGADPAGYWEGAIALPAASLGIRVDLVRGTNTAWEGRIEIPAQGLRGFRLDPVTVEGEAVRFAMPGMPGDPQFAGRLGADGNALSGDFTQSGQTYAFRLERKVRPASRAGETPSRGVAGKGLTGYWQGPLKPTPVVELRLVLEITNVHGAKGGGVMISLDQGSARLPITGLTEDAGKVRLETQSVGGVFDGQMSSDGSEIRTVELPGLNHLFQTCQSGAMAEYGQIEETFQPAALRLISDWIRETVAR